MSDLGYLFIIVGGLVVLSGPWIAQVIWLAGVGIEMWLRHDREAAS